MTHELEDEIFRRIDQHKHQLVGLTQQLIRIPSVTPPGNETPVAELAATELKKLGFVTRFAEAEAGRANLIAHLRGTKESRRVCAFAHTDVVPAGNLEEWVVEPFSGEIVDGKIYGRGACDHKFPIAALIYAARAVSEVVPSLDGDLILAFTADEEGGSEKGLKYVLEKGLVKADIGLYAGPSSTSQPEKIPGLKKDNVIIASNGFISYRLSIKGKSAHMMSLESGTNAIDKAAETIVKLKPLVQLVNQRIDSLTGRARMSINIIGGGQGEGVVPDKCEFVVDRFTTPGERAEDASAELRELIERLRREDSDLSIDIQETIRTPSARISEDSGLVGVIQASGVKIRGNMPTAVGISSFTDMGWFQNLLSSPVALFGYGDLSIAHEPNEHIAIPDLIDSAKAYAFIILHLLNTDY